jgi:hypothetical protein
MTRNPIFAFCFLVASIALLAVSAVAGPFAISGGASTAGVGSDTQITFNDAGTAAGSAGLTFDKTNKAVTLGGATVTTDNPILNLTQTWNAAGVTFNAIKLNVTSTASAAASKLADLQVAAASKFSVDKSGNVIAAGTILTATGSAGTPGVEVGNTNMGWWNNSGVQLNAATSGATRASITSAGIALGSTNGYQFRNQADPSGGSIDSGLSRNASKVVEVNDGTASSYVGTALVLGPQTVAQLPSCASGTKGARATVTDATSTTFLATATGGGANNVPTFCNGTNWLIG